MAKSTRSTRSTSSGQASSGQTRKYDSKKLLVRLNDRFPNFLLGLTVFVLVILVGSLFFQSKDLSSLNIPQSITNLFGGKAEVSDEATPKTYRVKAGDTLWSIAEEAYGSGYNAYDLARLNNMTDADALNEGTVLSLPALEPKDPTRGEIAGGSYTTKQETPQPTPQLEAMKPSQTYKIVAGDTLWAIALKNYGNPYKWVELQAVNPSITNPNLIYAGDTLKLL